MAKQVKLTARPRPESGRNAVKQVRARGGVPAVIYGSKDKPANLEVSRRAIEALRTGRYAAAVARRRPRVPPARLTLPGAQPT